MISVIIPTYNEAKKISDTIHRIFSVAGDHPIEIIVVDGGSSDETVKIAESCKASVFISDRRGRAIQMNAGARHASGEILYFIHADTNPPRNFTELILTATKKGIASGCFKLAFDHDHWFLKTNCWFTRFNLTVLRFGDQSLFVTRDVFEKCQGFREDLFIMEDQEIISRIKNFGRFAVLDGTVVTSARKYLANGIYRMQCIFYSIWMLYYLGYSQEQLMRVYKKFIREA